MPGCWCSGHCFTWFLEFIHMSQRAHWDISKSRKPCTLTSVSFFCFFLSFIDMKFRVGILRWHVWRPISSRSWESALTGWWGHSSHYGNFCILGAYRLIWLFSFPSSDRDGDRVGLNGGLIKFLFYF